MVIYTRKKRRNGLKVFFFSTIIILIVAFVSYYYLKQDMDYNLLSIQNQENKELENDIEIISNNEPVSQNFVERSELEQIIQNSINNSSIKELNNSFVEYDELDNIIEEFIKNNPKIILDVLRDFQNKQNQIEQERISNENLTNIENIYSSEHTMFIGDKNAEKKIFEFVDYNCGYCLKFHNEIMKVIDNDQNLQLVIIQMPILGSMSYDLSKLALAASLQNKFKEVHNYLYSSDRKSKMDDILADLFLMNVNLSQLELDLESEEIKKLSDIHKNYVNDFKFSGTPAIIIGNTIIPGFISSEKILEILEKEFS